MRVHVDANAEKKDKKNRWLWTLPGVLWLFPHLDLSLREVSWLGLAAALCRTAVGLAFHRRQTVPPFLLGVALAAGAAHELSTPGSIG